MRHIFMTDCVAKDSRYAVDYAIFRHQLNRFGPS